MWPPLLTRSPRHCAHGLPVMLDSRPTVGSLFSGIGGIDLGLERVGFRPAWFCERDEWCQKILHKHWPEVHCYGDIHDIGKDAPSVDVLAGGFPCQPVSVAGRQLGKDDPRWLWPEFWRLIRILRPRVALLENVPGLFRHGFGGIISDLAASGYDAEWDCIPAAAVGAPHRRDRVFIIATRCGGVADPDRTARGQSRRASETLLESGAVERSRRRGSVLSPVADPTSGGQPRPGEPIHTGDSAASSEGETVESFNGGVSGIWPIEPAVGRVANGIPRRVDRLRGLGNAVVPQVAEVVGRRVMEILRGN